MQTDSKTLPKRVLAILGMHRSGTSCLTGSLQDLGVELGDCHTWNPYNTKGNRENQDFVDLHDAILRANQGSWDSPPRRRKWSAEHLESGRKLLAQHADAEVFGFKDPRSLLLFDGWKALLPSIERVGVFRHPEAVAKSLSHRSDMDRGHALKLWFSYNSALWREYQSAHFPILCFDAEESEFQQKVSQLARVMKLKGKQSLPSFYDGELKKFSGESLSGLPWRVKRLYKKLYEVSY